MPHDGGNAADIGSFRAFDDKLIMNMAADLLIGKILHFPQIIFPEKAYRKCINHDELQVNADMTFDLIGNLETIDYKTADSKEIIASYER